MYLKNLEVHMEREKKRGRWIIIEIIKIEDDFPDSWGSSNSDVNI